MQLREAVSTRLCRLMCGKTAPFRRDGLIDGEAMPPMPKSDAQPLKRN